MAILAAAVVVVGVLCVLDLLLTVGVVRRLRVHTDLLNQTHGETPSVTDLAVGSIPDSFAGHGSDGEAVAGPAGWRIVAFFSSSCSVCPKRVPGFIDYVRAQRLHRDSVLAVLTGPSGDPLPYASTLAEVARLCPAGDGSGPEKAFKVAAYPAFFLLDDAGAVQAASYDPAALPELAVA